MTRILKALCLFAVAALSRQAYAQSIGPSTLNAAGGTAAIGSNIYDWSVGEMTMVSTFTTPEITVTQGMLQPYDTALSASQSAWLNICRYTPILPVPKLISHTHPLQTVLSLTGLWT